MRRTLLGRQRKRGENDRVPPWYPDSQKLGIWAPGGIDNVMLHRADGAVD